MGPIASKTHAFLDVTIDAGCAGLALLPGGSPQVRAAAAAGALAHTALGAATDYEGGVVGAIGLGPHRAAEAAMGLGLVLASYGQRRGRLLALLGIAQITLAAIGPARAGSGVPDMSYRPLGVLKPLADRVWCVDSALHAGLPVRMTVLQLEDGSLLLHSPVAFSDTLRAALERIGPVRHLVAPSWAHWIFVKDWQDALPGATVWAAPGLGGRGQVAKSDLRIDHELSDQAPPVWSREIEQVVVPGAGGFTEVAMLHRPSGTALMTDLVQNFEPHRLPWLLRPLTRLLGNAAPEGGSPAHLRGVVLLGGAKARAAGRRIADWAPRRIIVTHGAPIETDAPRKLRRALAWLS